MIDITLMITLYLSILEPTSLQDEAGTLLESDMATTGTSTESFLRGVAGDATSASGGTELGNTASVLTFKTLSYKFSKISKIDCNFFSCQLRPP